MKPPPKPPTPPFARYVAPMVLANAHAVCNRLSDAYTRWARGRGVPPDIHAVYVPPFSIGRPHALMVQSTGQPTLAAIYLTATSADGEKWKVVQLGGPHAAGAALEIALNTVTGQVEAVAQERKEKAERPRKPGPASDYEEPKQEFEELDEI